MKLFSLSPEGWYRAHNATVVGDVTAGPGSSFWFNTVVRGDVAKVVIGSRTNVQDAAVIHCDGGIDNHIGDDVVIGHGAIVHGRNVGDGTLIGMAAVVLGRTVIGRRCLIAAGAVVPPGMVVPDDSVVMGVPGKLVRPIKPSEREYAARLAAHYVELAVRYTAGEFG